MVARPRDWSWNTRRYPSPDYDLWIVLDGEGTVFAAKSAEASAGDSRQEQAFPVMAGSCFLLRPGGRYRGLQNPDRPLTVFYLHFALLDPDGAMRNLEEEFPLFRSLSEMDFIGRMLQRIVDACSAGQPDTAACWLHAVLEEIRQQDRQPSGSPVHEQLRAQIQDLCRRIQQQPGADYRLKTVSAACGYSADYFGGQFRAAAGIPLSEYVIAARLNRARFLLRETDQKLSRIAESLGYQDVSFFCRQFKNRTGYSPGQFRRQSRPDSRLPDSQS